MPENATGNFDTKNDDIVFVYEPDTEHVKVSYFDDWGHKLAEDEDVAGDFGSKYQTKPKNFAQYQLIQASPNANGKFGRHNADVHYVYTKIEQPQSSAVSSASSAMSSAVSSSAESKTSSATSSASSTQSSAANSASSAESKTSSAASSASSTQSSVASSASSAESKTLSAASSVSSLQSSAASSAVSSAESKTSSAASSAASTQSSVASSTASSTQSSAASSSAASSVVLSSVVTHWLDENGKELKPQENGAHPDNDNISDINGYKLASTEVDAKGNVINRYVKDDSIKSATANLSIKQDDAKQTETNANNAQNNADGKTPGAKTSDKHEKQTGTSTDNAPASTSTDNAPAGTNTPNNADQQVSTGKTEVIPASTSASASRLPQTGDETIKLSAAGLSLLASLGLTAIGIRKRKED